MQVLYHTAELKHTGFGRPAPRHGLHLLHWFSTKCVKFEGYRIFPCCFPEEGDFGFHLFGNRPERNCAQLLPHINFHYYVVGNLSRDGADELPDYVRQAYTGSYDNSNKDRIIVSFKNNYFDKVYITEHSDEWNYDPDKTYNIHPKLIKYISRKNSTEFLNEMGIRSTDRVMSHTHDTHITLNDNTEKETSHSRGFWDYCTIL